MSQINFEYGQGYIGVLLNLKEGGFHACTEKDFYERFGGKQYYTSRSGLSGAGWIPGKPWLMDVQGYRVDIALGEIVFRDMDIFGYEIAVPFHYRGDWRATAFPVIVRRKADGVTFLCSDRDFMRVLEGDTENFEERIVHVRFIPDPESTVHEERAYSIFLSSDAPKHYLRRVVEALHHQELGFVFPEGGIIPNPFWKRLGMYAIGGNAYKITGGICRGTMLLHEWTQEKLQEFAPGNVLLLERNIYIQGQGSHWEAIGIFEIEGREYDFEIPITPEEAAQLLSGQRNAEEIRARLLAGATEKALQVRLWEERQRAAQIAED